MKSSMSLRAPVSLVPFETRNRHPRLRKTAAALMWADDAFSTGQRLWKWWDERHRYLTTIRSDDTLYPLVHAWFMSLLSEDDRRSLVLTSHRIDEEDDAEVVHESGHRSPRRVQALSDDGRTRTFMLGEHKIRAWVNRADEGSVDVRGNIRISPDALIFAARTPEGQQVVRKEVERIAREYGGKRKPVLHLLTTWGSWTTRPDLPLRPLDSVVLREGLCEEIVIDFERFLTSERAYVERGMPWHRGYLFHGPPGTGKTSLARGLAQHFGLDLWYVPLNDLSRDASLLNLLSQVTPRSILLLEDIDVLKSAHDRDEGGESQQGQVSLSGLLNGLDGVATPHGLIKIMTTNDKSTLDPALIRPGRTDMQVLIDTLNTDQAHRLYRRFYGHRPSGTIHMPPGATAADLLERFKRYAEDPEAALNAPWEVPA